MNEPPFLSRHDIEQQLERLYEAERKRHLVAFHGTGTPEVLTTGRAGRFEVVPVASELDLRERLPPLGGAERLVFLVPWSGAIPLDIAGRFALGGKVLRIGREARLARLFEATWVDPEALACPLADYLLRPEHDRRYSVPGGRLTVDAMWLGWLGTCGVPVEGGLGLDAVLAWAARDARGPRIAAELATHAAAGVGAALVRFLGDKLGPAGPVVWSAWQRGRGAVALELALLFETLSEKPDAAVRVWVRERVRTELDVDGPDATLGVARSLGVVAASALRDFEGRSDAATWERSSKSAAFRSRAPRPRAPDGTRERGPCVSEGRARS